MSASLLRLVVAFSSLFLFQLCHSSHSSLPTGAHPLDEKFYESEVIKCKDGSKSFTRDRINDNFCDCPDGSDEPGTSACPAGKFYCKNVGSTPQFLYSSRVNDDICDCCDGSDEYDRTVNCPNTCIMGGNFAYHSISYDSTVRDRNSFGTGRNKPGSNAEESKEKLKGSLCYCYCGLLVKSLPRQVEKASFPLNNSGKVCARMVLHYSAPFSPSEY